jgi:Flp pilus assembly protein TadD
MNIFDRFRTTTVVAALALLPICAHAQMGDQSDAQAGATLSQALTTLNTDPQNVRALIAAGRAALVLDDTNGALGFFARAEQIDPRNGQVKMGLARAMLMTERPREAIKLFDDAVDLGVPEGEVAGDRGLAYDLRGDARRAQRDYALALRRGSDPEVTRRMALSLAISGDREQAVEVLEPLLRMQDRAAWRARAFILAITGDVAGANGVARTVMPPNLAQPMAPFFARLGSLSPAQKAAAVHFGRIPSDGRTVQVLASADIDSRPPQPSVNRLVPMNDAMDSGHDDNETVDVPVPTRPAPVPVSREPRRRPGEALASISAAQSQPPVAARPAPAEPMVRNESPVPGFSQPFITSQRPVQLAQANPPPAAVPARTLPPAAAVFPPAPATTVAAVSQPQPEPEPRPAPPAPQQQALTPPPPEPTASRPTPLERSLATIVGDLQLEQAEQVELPAARAPVPRVAALPERDKLADDRKAADKKVADKKAADKKAAEKKEAAKPDPKKQFPERIWAQVATGASKPALITDFGKLAKKSPAAFKGMSGWSVPFNRTRRLLVGPFATEKKAEDFLKKAGISGFAWTSPAGTEVEKLK